MINNGESDINDWEYWKMAEQLDTSEHLFCEENQDVESTSHQQKNWEVTNTESCKLHGENRLGTHSILKITE